jgi:transposase
VENIGLFQAALGLGEPWVVERVEFDPKGGRLDLFLGFPRGQRFPCPEGDLAACPVHDTKEKTWRHLDFFQHQAYLHARVPRVKCSVHGTLQVEVPWARPDSGFTLLFEALLLEFAPHMPVAAISRLVREHDTRIWRVLEHYVAAARAGLDLSQVTRVGVDETSARRGQDYVSIFMDLDQPRVVYATEGRDAGTVGRFVEDLKAHRGDPEQVASVTCDMSQAFLSGVNQHLPQAEITYDRYHVVAKLNEAVDQVRREEARRRPELAGSRYLWLKNEANLTEPQVRQKIWLSRPSAQLATARAWRWKDDFNGFYEQPVRRAEAYLERWCYGAKRSRMEPLKTFVRMIEAHWEGIVRWHQTRTSTGLLEGTNSLIQAAKRKARGYRNKRKMITIIYLIAGRLPLPSTHSI